MANAAARCAPLFVAAPPLPRRAAARRRARPRVSRCVAQQARAAHPLLTDRAAQRAFLEAHWGKRPLLIRGLLPFVSPLTPDELAGLSTQTPHARIIRGRGDAVSHARAPYTLQLGPFSDDTFDTLGDADWTLLVDHVNRHVPELAHLLDCFSFLPNWRFDDVMLSYAAPGGSVGPHVDNYDVFLLQGAGKRLWKTSYSPIPHDEERLVPGLDIRVLEGGFEADEQWVLEPGDALYVPPRFPHHGISLDHECMTYSVGFRAPNVATLAAGWVQRIIETRVLDDVFYADDVADLIDSAGDPGRVTRRAVDNAYQLVMRQLMDAGKEDFAKWFTEEVSQQKSFVDMDPMPAPDGVPHLVDSLILEPDESGIEPLLVRQREGSVFTYLETADDVCMYIDGEAWSVENVQIAATVCGMRCRPSTEYAQLASEFPSVRDLLCRLIEADILYVADDDGLDEDEDDIDAQCNTASTV